MNCDACQEQLHQTLDGTEPLDCAALEQHLHSCASCQAHRAAVQRLQKGLNLLRPPVFPTGLSARLVAAVREDRRRARQRVRLSSVVIFAAAACVIAGVAIALWPSRPTSPMSLPEVAVKPEPSAPAPAATRTTPRQSVETAVDAMASLTTRTTNQTVEQTKKLIPLVEPTLSPLTWEPALLTLSLDGAGQGFREGLEPMSTQAKRAVGLLRRDMLPDF